MTTGLRAKRLLGKVVVATGAARDQGAAEAAALTREGARVIATDMTDAPGCHRLDVTGEKDWVQLAADLREALGRCRAWSTTRRQAVHPETLTGGRRVHRVTTDLAVLDVTEGGLALVETAPGVTVADIAARTDAFLCTDDLSAAC